jgi:hypothetical protein
MINKDANKSWIGPYARENVIGYRFLKIKGEIWSLVHAQAVFKLYDSHIDNTSFRDDFSISDDKLDKLVQKYYPRFKQDSHLYWLVHLRPIFKVRLFDGIVEVELKNVSAEKKDGIFRVDMEISKKLLSSGTEVGRQMWKERLQIQDARFSFWLDFNEKSITRVEGDVFDLNIKNIHGESIREKYNED